MKNEDFDEGTVPDNLPETTDIAACTATVPFADDTPETSTVTTEEPPPLPEPVPETTAEQKHELPLTAAEVDRLISQAEQRGWLRARNELAAELMDRPSLLENPCLSPATSGQRNRNDTFAERFLNQLSRDVWDE